MSSEPVQKVAPFFAKDVEIKNSIHEVGEVGRNGHGLSTSGTESESSSGSPALGLSRGESEVRSGVDPLSWRGLIRQREPRGFPSGWKEGQ